MAMANPFTRAFASAARKAGETGKPTSVEINPQEPVVVFGWNEAFDVCREGDRPLVVRAPNGQRTKIYPSGHAKALHGRSGSWDIEIDPTT